MFQSCFGPCLGENPGDAAADVDQGGLFLLVTTETACEFGIEKGLSSSVLDASESPAFWTAVYSLLFSNWYS